MIFTTIKIRLTETEFAINIVANLQNSLLCAKTDLELNGFKNTVIGLR